MRIARSCIVVFSWAAIAFGADPDPFIGRWKLNWDKSHSSDAKPKSALRSYKKSGNGVRVSELWVDQNGKRIKLDYVAAYDGKDYPVRTASGNTASFTRPDAHTVVGSSKTKGNVAYTFKRVVSEDARTLTIHLTRPDAGGTPTQVLVYDRVR
jgi:hypothetical protein